ncbi:unnamed protein product, partial [Urochloa humidicola]
GVAAIGVDVARVLVNDREVGGEGFCPGRRDGMDSWGRAAAKFDIQSRATMALWCLLAGRALHTCQGEYVSRLSLLDGKYQV